jgi:hypothetical protein
MIMPIKRKTGGETMPNITPAIYLQNIRAAAQRNLPQVRPKHGPPGGHMKSLERLNHYRGSHLHAKQSPDTAFFFTGQTKETV